MGKWKYKVGDKVFNVEEKIKEVETFKNSVLQHLGCGDNSCYYVKSKGMSTNGGCRCFREYSKARWIERGFRKFLSDIPWLIETIDEELVKRKVRSCGCHSKNTKEKLEHAKRTIKTAYEDTGDEYYNNVLKEL